MPSSTSLSSSSELYEYAPSRSIMSLLPHHAAECRGRSFTSLILICVDWSSFLITFPVNFHYKAYSLAHMRTPTSVSLSVGEGVSLH